MSELTKEQVDNFRFSSRGDVHALVGEVDRLRAALAALEQQLQEAQAEVLAIACLLGCEVEQIGATLETNSIRCREQLEAKERELQEVTGEFTHEFDERTKLLRRIIDLERDLGTARGALQLAQSMVCDDYCGTCEGFVHESGCARLTEALAALNKGETT